ncbi:4-hydroxy-2-oxoglutarate aldolase [Geosmithia morbida]|uniref:4-hydroxy-2-oxoglutarate aldolase n=1 Tax=Geosmithia morbida TaxID=1094350 RepID=A0A9P4YN80_9HYPO|nr:4-hydroxy-2-oxoglutarate aldolase [Geosmithia morbida]KAF4120051.1 4-hydroxy-2-oxoglutarate aldolase [Geosmithia morbida]
MSKIGSPKARPLPAGVYTPVITLYNTTPSQTVDLPAMYRHCQHLASSGMHGLVYLGTNGELALLTRDERRQIIANAKRALVDMGLSEYPLVAGISAQSTAETALCAQEAAEAGALWGLLLPPSYWAKALSSDALVGYYRDVADTSPIPIIIYNFPGVTAGVDLDSDQIATLAAHPNIVATKLTCGNLGKLTRLTSRFLPSHFGVYGGSSDYLLPTLHAGGNGCVTGMGNVFPRSTARVFDLWKEGRLEEAAALQDLVANAEWACKKGLGCTKYGAWWYLGKDIGIVDEAAFHMRKPYQDIPEAMKKWSVDTLGVLADTEKKLAAEGR